MNTLSVIKIVHQLEMYADSGDIRRVVETLRCQPSWYLSGLEQSLSEIEKTYGLILDYYGSSVVDPKREEIHHKVLSGLYEIMYRWQDAAMDRTKSYGENWDALGCEKSSNVDVNASAKKQISRDEQLKILFDNTYILMPTKETISSVDMFLFDDSTDNRERCMIIGAVIFAVSQRFIPGYIAILIKMCGAKDLETRVRAIVGLMLSLQKHCDRVLLDSSLVSRLIVLMDDAKVKSAMLSAYMLLLRSYQTQKIADKVGNEITPDIISSNMNIDFRRSDGDMISDWNEIISSNNKLKKDIDKLYKWQMEGADILLGTFVHLKDYSMFKHLSGWFKPFYEDANELVQVKQVLSEVGCANIVKRIADSSVMCDSDKYSFVLTFASIPHDHIQMICSSYMQQIEAADEQIDKDGGDMSFSIRANLFVHDLYRVYHVHYKKAGFENPFEEIEKFVGRSKLFKMLFTVQEMDLIGDSLGKYEQYASAAIVYENLLDVDGREEYNDKLAYCYISMGKYSQALNKLECSEAIGGKTYWRLKMKAMCYDELNLYSREIESLKEIVSQKPDDMSVKIKMANCYRKMKAYEEEMALRFEIDYMKPTTDTAFQTADCLLRQGQVDRAASYVTRMGDEVDSVILTASYKMCIHDTRGAIESLSHMAMADINKFACMYDTYVKSFALSGVSSDDLRIVADLASRELTKDK